MFIIGHLRGRSGRKVFPIEGTNGCVGVPINRIAHSKYFRRVLQTYNVNSSVEALDTMQGGNRQPCVKVIRNTLTSEKGEGNKTLVRAVLTPDKAKKRQNGRRFKEDGEPMFTLTAQDRHGVAIKEATKTCSCNQGTLEGYRIRKLTPKECWRLQGWDDESFEKAASVCSDSQLYKQAGNGVTVNVIYEIAKRLE